jgi:hypothetical protein
VLPGGEGGEEAIRSPTRSIRLAVLALLTAFGGTAAAVPAGADGSTPDTIGIQLLEAPANRRDDPRARAYIVDHLVPGSVIRRRVQVENNTTEQRQVRVYPGGASVAGGAFLFAEDGKPTELTTWTQVEPDKVTLKPREKATVQVTITVPPSAPSGERYGVIWAENPPPPGQDQVGTASKVGIRMYLDIGFGAELPSDFMIESVTPGRTPDGRPTLIAHVHNTGARALDMGGSLALTDGPGTPRAGPFPVIVGTTLGPGQSGPVPVHLDRELAGGPWSASLTLRSGRVEHTVHAAVTFPATGMGVPVTVSSADTPMRVVVSALGVLALLALSGFLLVRVRYRHRMARHRTTD